MVNFSGIMEKFKEMKADRDNAFDVTNPLVDRRLLSLRKMREKQLNEMEKKKLKTDITEYNKNKDREEIWGIKGGKVRKKITYGREESLLHDKKPLMKVTNYFKK